MTPLSFVLIVAAFFLGIAFGWIGGRVRQRRQARKLMHVIFETGTAQAPDQPVVMHHLRDELDQGEGYGRGRDDA